MKRDHRQPPAGLQNFHRRCPARVSKNRSRRSPRSAAPEKLSSPDAPFFRRRGDKPLNQFRQLPRRLKFSQLRGHARSPWQTAATRARRQIPKKSSPVRSALAPFTKSAAVSGCRSSIRMSSGPSCWKLNPRSGESSCGELTPKSSSTPSQLAAGTQSASSAKLPRRISNRPANLRQPRLAPLQPRRHRDRTQTAIQSANSRPECSPRDQPHRACRRRNGRPAAASARPAPPPPSLVCE